MKKRFCQFLPLSYTAEKELLFVRTQNWDTFFFTYLVAIRKVVNTLKKKQKLVNLDKNYSQIP